MFGASQNQQNSAAGPGGKIFYLISLKLKHNLKT